MTREEELKIIEQVQNGNRNAFETLVLEHQKKVYNLALRMVGNEDDAYDMAQESFIRAYNSIGSFRGDSKFSVWLYRLTSNVCIDFLRQKKRKPTVSTALVNDEDEEQELEIPDDRFEPQTELERRELNRAIQEGLSSLPDDYRQILLLRELEGLSYDEIAKALDIEAGTVKSRLFRARKRLCRILLDSGNISGLVPSSSSEGV